MFQSAQIKITPELFAAHKEKMLGIIAWAGVESGQVTSREFNELLAGYLTTAHFVFIEKEARLHHSIDEMKGSLTHRQNEILQLVIVGMTNKAVAETIMLSEATVHHEVTKILSAFHVTTRGALIQYFKNIGWFLATTEPLDTLERERERERERDLSPE